MACSLEWLEHCQGYRGRHPRIPLKIAKYYTNTIFSRSHSVARFYFKALFDVATIQGWHLQRWTCTHVYSFNNEPICMHVKCVCADVYRCRPCTMWHNFEDGVYQDELAEICGDISRVVGFRGNMVFIVECDKIIRVCGLRSHQKQSQRL